MRFLVRGMVQDGSISCDEGILMHGLYDMLGGLDVHSSVGVPHEPSSRHMHLNSFDAAVLGIQCICANQL